MTRSIVLAVAGVALSAGMLAFGYIAGSNVGVERTAAPQPQASATPTDRAAIEAIVREYLVTNPEIMIEVQTALETKQQEQQRATQQAAIAADKDAIFNAAYDGIVGNPDGKVTIVEFFDYNCGYCKRAMTDMEAMVKENGDLRFVLKEFPILGPDSQKAHIVSMAFRTLSPEKYGEFHRELLGGGGRASEERAIEIATGLGVEEAALREEMKNPEIMAAFAKTYEIANSLAITGTPSYVIGEEVVFGALGAEVLAEKVASLSQ